MSINAKVNLLHILSMTRDESVNNANTAYVQITTSTVGALLVDLNVFSYLKTVLNGNYTSNVKENIKCVFQINICTCICVM